MMRVFATFVIAIRAIRRNTMRSILTALGIIIGVGAVIAMVSIGNGAKEQIEGQIASLGQNIISVFPGSFTSGGARGGWGSASTLTPDDAQAIARDVNGIVAVSPEVRDRQQVLANGLNWNTTIYGESPDFLNIRSWHMAEGEMFTDSDVRSISKVCVIGKTIVDQLFPNEDPLGQTIRIRNIPVKIVGVLAPKGFNFFGSDQDDVVVVPYTTAMKRTGKRDRLSSILIQAQSPDLMPTIQQDITDLLQQRRQGREPDFTVRNQLELAQVATANTTAMTTLLGFIAGISLVVGGIGIMNIMLVSVTERTREIGIRLSVGAYESDVLLQFLAEAIVLSLMGGIIGIISGIVASHIISLKLGWPVTVSSAAVTISFVVSGMIGVFFGFYPARKAARLDPIDALRYE